MWREWHTDLQAAQLRLCLGSCRVVGRSLSAEDSVQALGARLVQALHHARLHNSLPVCPRVFPHAQSMTVAGRAPSDGVWPSREVSVPMGVGTEDACQAMQQCIEPEVCQTATASMRL